MDALWAELGMMALGPITAVVGSFETCHNHLAGGHMLAFVSHNLEILGLSWCVVANCELC